MKIAFDPASLAAFSASGVRDVRVSLVSRGCAGTEVSVDAEFPRAGLAAFPAADGLSAWASPEDAAKLDGGRLTRNTAGKWIFDSPGVQGRCGCGKSFSFSALPPQDPAKAKIHALSAALGASGKLAALREAAARAKSA